MSLGHKQLRLLASTGTVYQCSIKESWKREARQPADVPSLGDETESNVFKSAQWTADGTSIVTSSEDDHIRTFILPTDLLTVREDPQQLKPYSIIVAPEPVYATSLHPYFNLQDTNTTLSLSSPRSHPIALHSVLASSKLLASYPLIHEPTETYITPHSLLWTRGGTHFLAGNSSQIALFDVSRDGSGPISLMNTIPSRRKKLVGGGVGMKGIVSALATSVDRVLAAGTFTRCIGLYDAEGSGDCVAVFSVAGDGDDAVRGSGVTQVMWSACGRYLYVAERRSDSILVYDIRVAGKRLQSLTGRQAGTNQRLGISVVPTGKGSEVWAGGDDGVVRIWEGAEKEDISGEPSWCWKAHDDPVTSTIVHHSGSVVATCSGQRKPLSTDWEDSSDSDDSSMEDAQASSSASSSSSHQLPETKFMDNSLKVWKLDFDSEPEST
ncbi:MAG: hypothetical protein M1825_003195 [Sarcosagium campestre]|nr:MAG: hypothetical protein M1825_003195 [Sarcosagium campestre]